MSDERQQYPENEAIMRDAEAKALARARLKDPLPGLSLTRLNQWAISSDFVEEIVATARRLDMRVVPDDDIGLFVDAVRRGATVLCAPDVCSLIREHFSNGALTAVPIRESSLLPLGTMVAMWPISAVAPPDAGAGTG